jgi:hypothetical protein
VQVTFFALGAWQASGIIAYALLTQLGSQQLRSSYVRLPAVGVVPVSGVLAASASGALCATWAIWHNAVWSWPLQVLRLQWHSTRAALCSLDCCWLAVIKLCSPPTSSAALPELGLCSVCQ